VSIVLRKGAGTATTANHNEIVPDFCPLFTDVHVGDEAELVTV
jgi:hypothetical protein